MKPKIYLLAVSLLGFVAAKANTGPDPNIGGKRVDEINGIIFDSEKKKPLKDVTITAYYSSKKEKTIQTDETGNYAFDELKPGTYKFVFEKAGYKKVTKEKVVIKTDETFQLNIEMIGSNDFELMPSPFHFSDF
ncbi:MAG TPA: carboxypeptidase-like regulatory domain-containing protein [Chitinophagaceae bacterium]|nr:carboxypeptidase-like regulatory domain-containing protein [Chitinophagaceae bacterium]